MTSTIKPSESSALFSLQQLMDIEEERLQQEEAERRSKAEAALRAEQEALLKRQQEEEARVAQARAEEDGRRRRDREHQVQMEAMRAAIIEQQRIKTERQAEQQKDALRMENEREMARIAQQSAAKKLRKALLGVSLGAVAVIAGGLGLYFGKIKPDNDLKAEAIAQEARDAQEARASAEREKAAVQAQIAQLQRELLAARTPAERADISDKINTLTKKNSPLAVTKTTPKTEAKTPGEVCQKGDPMCKQLPLRPAALASAGVGASSGEPPRPLHHRAAHPSGSPRWCGEGRSRSHSPGRARGHASRPLIAGPAGCMPRGPASGRLAAVECEFGATPSPRAPGAAAGAFGGLSEYERGATPPLALRGGQGAAGACRRPPSGPPTPPSPPPVVQARSLTYRRAPSRFDVPSRRLPAPSGRVPRSCWRRVKRAAQRRAARNRSRSPSETL